MQRIQLRLAEESLLAAAEARQRKAREEQRKAQAEDEERQRKAREEERKARDEQRKAQADEEDRQRKAKLDEARLALDAESLQAGAANERDHNAKSLQAKAENEREHNQGMREIHREYKQSLLQVQREGNTIYKEYLTEQMAFEKTKTCALHSLIPYPQLLSTCLMDVACMQLCLSCSPPDVAVKGPETRCLGVKQVPSGWHQVSWCRCCIYIPQVARRMRSSDATGQSGCMFLTRRCHICDLVPVLGRPARVRAVLSASSVEFSSIWYSWPLNSIL